MKRKICFLLTWMTLAALLTCACSAGEKTEKAPESGKDVAAEAAVEEATVEEAPAAKPDDSAPSVITMDLNRNGILEEVRLTDIDDGQQLEILENGERIYFREGSFAHAGRRSVFLCKLDGTDYILNYGPTMYQGVCTYSYGLFFVEGGEERLLQERHIEFDINFGSLVHDVFDPQAIDAFMEELNGLLVQSVQLMNTDSDLLSTFEKEGRLYDSLWWLDGWEPEFVRDENKSLLENLKDFQSAMTAAKEPVPAKEESGLPVTKPLEMVFSSGAGAWGTALTLHPDGSFTADYSDADMLTVYVCQYHGRFGKVEKLTENSWRLTLEELSLDTGHSVGEEWEKKENEYTFHYISSEPHGFTDKDGKALKPGAKFILYSPDAAGHEPGTELYGAVEFQNWMHERREFQTAGDVLGCWGLQNMETGYGFFSAPDEDR